MDTCRKSTLRIAETVGESGSHGITRVSRISRSGVNLSNGQRQRIAIARALLKHPKILIFDEATSNLDGETSERFAATVNKLKGKVTMIFIAHQLTRTLKLDHIVRIDAESAASAATAANATTGSGVAGADFEGGQRVR